MIHALTNVFTYIRDVETIPKEWGHGLIKPNVSLDQLITLITIGV